MLGFVSGKKRFTEPNMCFSNSVKQNVPACSKSNPRFSSQVVYDRDSPILAGLPDDVAKYCLALVPRSNFPAMGGVCKRWRSFIQSKEFITVRKLAGVLEEWLYVLTMDAEGKESHWEVLDCLGHKQRFLPTMPGPVKAGFGVVVLNGKLFVMGGYSVIDGTGSASADVYQYDSCLDRFVFVAFSLKAWDSLAFYRIDQFKLVRAIESDQLSNSIEGFMRFVYSCLFCILFWLGSLISVGGSFFEVL